MGRYQIRAFKEGDEEGILRLFKDVFGKDRTIEEWQWRFENNPAGKSIIYVAVEDEKVIGHYAVSPAVFYIHGKEHVGMQEVDLMVSPEYTKGLKKAGVFLRLGKSLYKAVTENGIKFTFGFPNQNSSPVGSKMLGWQAVAEIPLYSLYLRANIINEKLKGNPLKKTIAVFLFRIYFFCCKLIRILILKKCTAIERVDKFDERADTLWEDSKPHYEILTARTKEYLNWRYFSLPSKEYMVFGLHSHDTLAGYIVLKIIRAERGMYKEGLIIDIFTEWDNADVAKLLLVKAIEYFERKKCDVVRVWMMLDFFYSNVLHQLGFKRASSKITLFINTMGEDPINEKLKTSKWFLQMADSDGV